VYTNFKKFHYLFHFLKITWIFKTNENVILVLDLLVYTIKIYRFGNVIEVRWFVNAVPTILHIIDLHICTFLFK